MFRPLRVVHILPSPALRAATSFRSTTRGSGDQLWIKTLDPLKRPSHRRFQGF